MTKAKRTLATLELVGGNLCLDLANIVNVRPVPEHDYLSSYQSLLDWSDKVAALSARHLQLLAQLAATQADDAQEVLKRTQQFREMVYRTFARIAARSAPDKADLQGIQDLHGSACLHAQLAWQQDRYVLEWEVVPNLESVLWPLGYAAGALLRADELKHVKACPACGWLFLDTSKNGQRRWCSMQTCGVRDKMQRYHQRLRSSQSGSDS